MKGYIYVKVKGIADNDERYLYIQVNAIEQIVPKGDTQTNIYLNSGNCVETMEKCQDILMKIRTTTR